MEQLIKIIEKDGQQLVSAIELYAFLGLDKSNYAKWAKNNITDNPYFVENEDWCAFVPEYERTVSGNYNPNPTTDYLLKIDMAKKLSMLTKTEQGNRIRNYFIAVEKKLKEVISQSQFNIPQTLSQALMLAAQQAEQIEQQQALLLEQAPKVEFADSVKASIDDISVDELAKLIAQNGIEIGEIRLFKWMRKNKYLTKDNIPFQKWIERGFFKLEQKIRINYKQELVAYFQTKITATGQIYFMNKFLNYGKEESSS